MEPTEDGKRWRVKPEGGDVEGHMPLRRAFDAEGGDSEGHMPRRLEIEPAGEEDGEPVYRVTLDGEDVDGHLWKQYRSDERLKRSIAPVVGPLESLRDISSAGR